MKVSQDWQILDEDICISTRSNRLRILMNRDVSSLDAIGSLAVFLNSL